MKTFLTIAIVSFSLSNLKSQNKTKVSDDKVIINFNSLTDTTNIRDAKGFGVIPIEGQKSSVPVKTTLTITNTQSNLPNNQKSTEKKIETKNSK
jgi:hypothetical protein